MKTNGKDEWTVCSQVIGGTKKYIAGRKLNNNEVFHAGNVEYAPDMGYTEDRSEALMVCEKLNGCLPPRITRVDPPDDGLSGNRPKRPKGHTPAKPVLRSSRPPGQ